MSEVKYMPDMSFSKSGNRISFGVYNGQLNLAVFGPKGQGIKYSTKFRLIDIVRIRAALKKLIELPPDNQVSLVMNEFRDGSFKPAGAMVFGVTDKKVCFIELQVSKDGNNSVYAFDLIPGGVLRESAKDFDAAVASQEGVAALLWYIDVVLPAALCHSVLPVQRGGGSQPTTF